MCYGEDMIQQSHCEESEERGASLIPLVLVWLVKVQAHSYEYHKPVRCMHSNRDYRQHRGLAAWETGYLCPRSSHLQMHLLIKQSRGRNHETVDSKNCSSVKRTLIETMKPTNTQEQQKAKYVKCIISNF